MSHCLFLLIFFICTSTSPPHPLPAPFKPQLLTEVRALTHGKVRKHAYLFPILSQLPIFSRSDMSPPFPDSGQEPTRKTTAGYKQYAS